MSISPKQFIPHHHRKSGGASHSREGSACAECRRVHKKCNKERPCLRCSQLGIECVDTVAGRRGRPPKKIQSSSVTNNGTRMNSSSEASSLYSSSAISQQPSTEELKKKKLIFHSDYNYTTRRFNSLEIISDDTPDRQSTSTSSSTSYSSSQPMTSSLQVVYPRSESNTIPTQWVVQPSSSSSSSSYAGSFIDPTTTTTTSMHTIVPSNITNTSASSISSYHSSMTSSNYVSSSHQIANGAHMIIDQQPLQQQQIQQTYIPQQTVAPRQQQTMYTISQEPLPQLSNTLPSIRSLGILPANDQQQQKRNNL